MRRRFVLGADQPDQRIDKALPRLLPGTSRTSIQRWIAEGRVTLDGRPCNRRDNVAAGSIVEIEEGFRPISAAEPDPSVEFSVAYEDEHLIVVNKPAGLVVHPARGHRTGTLVNGLLARPGFAALPSDPRDAQGFLRPGIVHRIDKDTSGLLVVARTEESREGLKQQLLQHSMERVYRALTCGVPQSGTIKSLHARHPRSRLRFTSRLSRGRTAVTHVRVRELLAGRRVAALECRLETGRTHQIRVHLSEQTRTPVFGDALYGGIPTADDLRMLAVQFGRHALHAAVLGFQHPISGALLRFEAAEPADFQALVARLREL